MDTNIAQTIPNQPIAKATYTGGEALPVVGSEEYKKAQLLSSNTPTINSSQLSTQPSISVPQVQYNNSSQDILSSIALNNKNILDKLNAEANTNKTSYDTSKTNFEDTIKNILGVQQSRNTLESNALIPEKTKALTNITNEIESKQLALRRKLEDLSANNPQGLSAEGLKTESDRINREGTRELADLAIIQNAKNRDVQTAMSLIDKKIQNQLEPLQTLLQYQKQVLDDNRDIYTKSEQRSYENIIRQNEQKLSDERAKLKTLEDTKLQYQTIASYSNAPISVMKSIQGAKTPSEVLDIASQNNLVSVGDKLNLEQINKVITENKKIKAEITALGNPVITNPVTSKYTGAISTILGSSKLTKDQKQTFINSLNSGGDVPTILKNHAKDILGTTDGSLLGKYESGRDSLNDIGNLLQQFYANGGSTGLITGNLEKVSQNLGQVTDPNLRALATQINGAIAVYRNAISGTAYSEQEGKDINSIFPGINKSQSLNDAILKGRSRLFDSTIDSMYSRAIGADNWQTVKSNSLTDEQAKNYILNIVSSDPKKKQVYDFFKSIAPSATIQEVYNYLK